MSHVEREGLLAGIDAGKNTLDIFSVSGIGPFFFMNGGF